MFYQIIHQYDYIKILYIAFNVLLIVDMKDMNEA